MLLKCLSKVASFAPFSIVQAAIHISFDGMGVPWRCRSFTVFAKKTEVSGDITTAFTLGDFMKSIRFSSFDFLCFPLINPARNSPRTMGQSSISSAVRRMLHARGFPSMAFE